MISESRTNEKIELVYSLCTQTAVTDYKMKGIIATTLQRKQ